MRVTVRVSNLRPGDVLLATRRTVLNVAGAGAVRSVTLRDDRGEFMTTWGASTTVTVERGEQ